MSVFSLLGQLESRTVLDTMTKEVVGINAPRVALTRTNDERMDVAISAVGNTVGAFGTGYALDKILGKVFRKAQVAGGTAGNWAVLARSAAVFSAIFSIMWAMPYIRNYITAKRTGTVSFKDVIGAGGQQQAPDPAQVQKTIAGYRKTALTTLALGWGTALLSVAGALAAIKKGAGLGIFKKLFENAWLNKNLLLKGGSFADFSGVKALLFWGVPAYGGWIQASRDPYEKKEQLIKFANFVACFFGPSVLFEKYFGKKFAAVLPQGVEANYKSITAALAKASEGPARESLAKALKLWKIKSVGGLATSIVLLGSLPAAISIWLTGRRLKREQGNPARPASPPAASAALQPAPGALARKSFDQWGQRHA